MPRRPLRHGYTTGACAAAAALGAARMLKEQRRVESVELSLPAGFAATFILQGQRFSEKGAACFVVKDAGDDPDVTHGCEIRAEVRLIPPCATEGRSTPPPFGPPPCSTGGVIITGGKGIGRVTKPGLAVPVGEWAINPVPRRMITEAVLGEFSSESAPALEVTLSIPDGEQRARRTLNERLGIVGGLSILGTTGIVRPISHEAWTDTLDVALDVALAAGAETVVLSTGRTSELAAQEFLGAAGSNLQPEAFIMMGDHVDFALEAAHRRGFSGIVLAAQFAKLVKIAAGHPCTHVRSAGLELAQLAGWGREAGLDESAAKKIELANTAREALEHDRDGILAATVAARALDRARMRAPGARISIYLIDYRGRVTSRFGECPRN